MTAWHIASVVFFSLVGIGAVALAIWEIVRHADEIAVALGWKDRR